jgi:hypothetical protein
MTCSRRWRGNWSRGTASAIPPTPFGEPSPQNIKSCFQGDLIATMMPPPSNFRAFSWILSLTPRVLLKAPWTLRRSSSSDSDRNRCPVEGGAGGQLSRNRRHYSASVDLEAIGCRVPSQSSSFLTEIPSPEIAALASNSVVSALPHLSHVHKLCFKSTRRKEVCQKLVRSLATAAERLAAKN